MIQPSSWVHFPSMVASRWGCWLGGKGRAERAALLPQEAQTPNANILQCCHLLPPARPAPWAVPGARDTLRAPLCLCKVCLHQTFP